MLNKNITRALLLLLSFTFVSQQAYSEATSSANRYYNYNSSCSQPYAIERPYELWQFDQDLSPYQRLESLLNGESGCTFEFEKFPQIMGKVKAEKKKINGKLGYHLTISPKDSPYKNGISAKFFPHNERDVLAELSSLASLKNYEMSGRELLLFFTELCDQIGVQKILVEDGSYLNLKLENSTRNIELSLHSLHVWGDSSQKGWYESYGYQPITKEDLKLFSKADDSGYFPYRSSSDLDCDRDMDNATYEFIKQNLLSTPLSTLYDIRFFIEQKIAESKKCDLILIESLDFLNDLSQVYLDSTVLISDVLYELRHQDTFMHQRMLEFLYSHAGIIDLYIIDHHLNSNAFINNEIVQLSQLAVSSEILYTLIDTPLKLPAEERFEASTNQRQSNDDDLEDSFDKYASQKLLGTINSEQEKAYLNKLRAAFEEYHIEENGDVWTGKERYFAAYSIIDLLPQIMNIHHSISLNVILNLLNEKCHDELVYEIIADIPPKDGLSMSIGAYGVQIQQSGNKEYAENYPELIDDMYEAFFKLTELESVESIAQLESNPINKFYIMNFMKLFVSVKFYFCRDLGEAN
ncbi:hypothetical protein SCG7109_AS_00140 [Chlamydiales bacterium SCGC AG-110-M15]|nr:hypothetical protein SCG7109_AS_00140 [Chlamydiales bacterium SCGC AG-110-M15]